MTLKGSELTAAIVTAFEAEWAQTKGVPLPSSGAEDRRILFAAVAHGLLNYLEDNQSQLVTSITLQRAGTSTPYEVPSLDLGIEKGR